LAAGTKCEMKGYMKQGQTTSVMTTILQGFPRIDSERIRDGYQEGLHRTAIYSKIKSNWFPYKLTDEGLHRRPICH